MVNIIGVFNNREKALIIWLLVSLIWCLLQKKVRMIFCGLLRIIFSKKIILLFIAMFIYTVGEMYVLRKIHLYDISMIKDALLWYLCTASVMVINCSEESKNKRYFKKILLESLAVIILVEFIVNFYTFNLIVELILTPILFFVVATVAYSEAKKEDSEVKKLASCILAAYGWGLIIFAGCNLIKNFRTFATFDNLRAFLLSPLLTVLFLPFIYFFALAMAYESMFARLGIWIKGGTRLAKFTKVQIFRTCHFDLIKLNRFEMENVAMFPQLKNQDDVLRMIKRFKLGGVVSSHF